MSHWLGLLGLCVLLMACIKKGSNPVDPYESINRKTHKFNMAFDATFLKPPARLYVAILPASVRKGINNMYDNINMIPTVGNDLLQGQFRYAIKDSCRFIFNSTLGIGGFFDVAAARMSLPPHSNDLGVTFARWGDKHSPYIVIPFLGPSTIRDGMAMMFQYTFMTPYPFLHDQGVVYNILAVRYIDLRSQLFETEQLMNESFDKYTFIRDAYLQHRHYVINGETSSNTTAIDNNPDSLYVTEEAETTEGTSDYIDERPTK